MPARKRLLTRSDIESVKRIITHHDQQAFKYELLRKGNSLAERERRWAALLRKTLKAATLANALDSEADGVAECVTSTDGMTPDDTNPLT